MRKEQRLMGGLRIKCFTYTIVACFGCLIFCPLIYGASSFVIDTIALNETSGNRGPGLGSAVEFAGFGDPAINSSGDISFLGVLTGSAVGHTEGFWLNEGSANTPIALTHEEGTLGPGLGSGIYFDNMIGNGIISGGGQIVFGGFISGTGVNENNDSAFTRHASGVNSSFARTGVSNALGPSLGEEVLYEGFNNETRVNSEGTVVFSAGVVGPGVNPTNKGGVWRNTSVGNVILAQTGTAGMLGPNLGTSSVFGSANSTFGQLHILNESATVFFEGVSHTQSANVVDMGIWKNDDNANFPIAVSGQTGNLGPGLGNSMTFANVSQLPGDFFPFVPLTSVEFDANSQGDLVFSSTLSDGRRGVWRNLGVHNEPIMLEGQTGPLGPGLLNGETFDTFDLFTLSPEPTINDKQVSLFPGMLAGTHQQGLWLNDSGANQAIALTGDDGDLGPGLGPGVTFTGFNRAYFGSDDTIYFTADLSFNVPSNRLLGFFAYHKGEIHKIAVYGEPIDVDPTSEIDNRLVQWVQIPSDLSHEIGANRSDEVVFRVGFQDGAQGIFMTHLVPEPTSAVLLLLLVLVGNRTYYVRNAVS